MHIKELNSKKLYKEYSLEIPFNEVDNSINAKIREMIPTVTLPGFRKGKAPLNIVKKKYENNILNEVLENIIQEKTKQLLNEKKLNAFRQPKVEVKKYKRDEPIEFNLKIDLKPEMNIFPLDKIKTTDTSKLPELDSNLRIGACVSKPSKFIGKILNAPLNSLVLHNAIHIETSSDNNTISNNHVTANDKAIWISSNSDNNNISNNNVTANNSAIYFTWGFNNKIIDNDLTAINETIYLYLNSFFFN